MTPLGMLIFRSHGVDNILAIYSLRVDLCFIRRQSDHDPHRRLQCIYSASNRAGVQYSPGWNQATKGDASQRYQGTYTQNQVYGSQLWFAFRGNAIAYYADQNPGHGALAILFDGRENINLNWTNPSQSVLYQQNLWNVGNLDPSLDHTIVIGNTNENNASIGLDYFVVSSIEDDIRPQGYGPGASVIPGEAILVDNESSEVIFSSIAWESYSFSADSTAQNVFFNATEHCSNKPGAMMTFKFNGTAIWYFADGFWGNSKVSLSIDSGVGQVVDTATKRYVWNTQKLFWNASGLTPEPHTLTITHVGTDVDYACIDFLMYLPSSASSNNHTSSSPSKSTTVAAIAAGVAGGVVTIILLVILAVLLRRRKLRSLHDNNEHREETDNGDATFKAQQIDRSQDANHLGPVASDTYAQMPYGPYVNLDGGDMIVPSNSSGPTYKGHPEPQ